jgi:hypothetical protein
VYAANWTDNLPELFLRKRGYDLMAHLPALFDRNHADSRDLRADFWRTLSEQAFEGFGPATGGVGAREGRDRSGGIIRHAAGFARKLPGRRYPSGRAL